MKWKKRNQWKKRVFWRTDPRYFVLVFKISENTGSREFARGQKPLLHGQGIMLLLMAPTPVVMQQCLASKCGCFWACGWNRLVVLAFCFFFKTMFSGLFSESGSCTIEVACQIVTRMAVQRIGSQRRIHRSGTTTMATCPPLWPWWDTCSACLLPHLWLASWWVASEAGRLGFLG